MDGSPIFVIAARQQLQISDNAARHQSAIERKTFQMEISMPDMGLPLFVGWDGNPSIVCAVYMAMLGFPTQPTIAIPAYAEGVRSEGP
ncbi:hypothetical protein [Dyella choica]|uniref:Uncharacterized protein n=1 Tax=Dyella choica TaxID=1927959 RepID=A0A3S0PPB9_9GAMM|nr:hypothetical protein [Dyella choica]RUL76712.1 hypothetical protein EKH80_08315 [Dyella choica]